MEGRPEHHYHLGGSGQRRLQKARMAAVEGLKTPDKNCYIH
jgi:hypothetical protein